MQSDLILQQNEKHVPGTRAKHGGGCVKQLVTCVQEQVAIIITN
ncbi:MAG: hypothetical protein ACWGN1_02395 [Desulfobulbales bacterium]